MASIYAEQKASRTQKETDSVTDNGQFCDAVERSSGRSTATRGPTWPGRLRSHVSRRRNVSGAEPHRRKAGAVAGPHEAGHRALAGKMEHGHPLRQVDLLGYPGRLDVCRHPRQEGE